MLLVDMVCFALFNIEFIKYYLGYNGDNEYEAAKIDSIVEGSKDFIQALRKSANAPPDQKV